MKTREIVLTGRERQIIALCLDKLRDNYTIIDGSVQNLMPNTLRKIKEKVLTPIEDRHRREELSLFYRSINEEQDRKNRVLSEIRKANGL